MSKFFDQEWTYPGGADHGEAYDSSHGLSQRQFQCLALAAEGLTSKEIARRLNVSHSTVDSHVRAGMARLQVSDRRAAIRMLARYRRDSADRPVAEIAGISEQEVTSSAPHQRSLVPPLGGSANTLPLKTRLLMVLQVALLGAAAPTAIVFAIMGTVLVLSRLRG